MRESIRNNAVRILEKLFSTQQTFNHLQNYMFIYRNFFLDTQESVDLALKSEIIIQK